MIFQVEPAERAALVAHLQAALAAIENDDYSAWRQQIDALVQWRSRPLVQGLAQLARELGQALGEIPAGELAVADLPDACARLEHVVAMTEHASLRTLDLVEHSRTLVDRLVATEETADMLRQLRSDLSEISLAQTYQDLTGQIIRRVAGIVRRMHDSLVALGFQVDTGKASNSPLSGPAIAGLDAHAVSQDDADHLLSGLGL